jgi:phytoene dehydrogenase-like protein
MPDNKPRIVVVGAGINGLVAANYLQRGGCQVIVLERNDRVGGACVSAVAEVNGIRQPYALGASVLGLMQDFVFQETGLKKRLKTFVPSHPKIIFFPKDNTPTFLYRDPKMLERELAAKWGEQGSTEAFRSDEAQLIKYLQKGYREATPPTFPEAEAALGKELARLWISGSANDLLDHYFTSERTKVYMAMTVTESGPVSLHEPYSAFTIPLMDSGSVFGGYYGFVEGGIWRITEELGRINNEIGVETRLSCRVQNVDTARSVIHYESRGQQHDLPYDHLILATDPMTAAKLVGTESEIKSTNQLRFRGSSGKLSLMFRHPVRWKHGTQLSESDAAFRFIFSVNSLAEFETATLKVLDDRADYEPGYMQIYCEGAAMRHLNYKEHFDRLSIFFKNLSLKDSGELLEDVENQVKTTLSPYIDNLEDCVWSRLLTPRDMQQIFYFPEGNLDHTMLVGQQTFFDRNYSNDPSNRFYNFGDLANVYLCASGSYPCGSVAGTPGYMCSRQLLRNM